MRRHFLISFACLLVLSAASAGFAQVDTLRRQESYFKRAMTDWDTPGMAISVVKDDKIIFAQGYGVRLDGYLLSSVAL